MKIEDNPFVVTSKVLKAKLFLSEEWSKSNLPSLNSNCVYKYDPLPPLIVLEDSEKFMDDLGNLYNVETRGERSEDKVFFKAKDVARVFDMKHNLVALKYPVALSITSLKSPKRP
jgi:hypothetical protein